MTTLPAPVPVLSPRASVIVLVLALSVVVICWLIPSANSGNDIGVSMDLPTEIAGLEGIPLPVSQAEREILPPDTQFAGKAYGAFSIPSSDWWDRIVCKIVLSGSEKQSLHRPERCLPGQGWTITDSKVIDVPLDSGHPLKVTALLLNRPITLANGTTKQLEFCYFYWYVGRDISTPYAFVRVFSTTWNLIAHRTNERWSYVICAAYVTDTLFPEGRNQEQTVDYLKRFIRDAAPTFMKSEMPDEKTAGLSL